MAISTDTKCGLINPHFSISKKQIQRKELRAMFTQDFEANLQTKEDAIDYKVQFLYDFRILKPLYEHAVTSYGDPNEEYVRKALEKCETYSDMSRRLYALLREDETIEEFCQRFQA